MGMSSHVYIGAYVRCTNTMTEAMTSKRVCQSSRPDCPASFPDRPNYCTMCGSPIIDKLVPVKRMVVDHNQIEDEIQCTLRAYGKQCSGAFGGEKYDFYVPNKSWRDKLDRNIGPNFAGELRIKDSDLPTERVNFEVAFQKEIARLRLAYGSEKVEVRWGVLGEWM